MQIMSKWCKNLFYPESFLAVLDKHQLSVPLDVSALDHFPDVMAFFGNVEVHMSRVFFDLLVFLCDSFSLDVYKLLSVLSE